MLIQHKKRNESLNFLLVFLTETTQEGWASVVMAEWLIGRRTSDSSKRYLAFKTSGLTLSFWSDICQAHYFTLIICF